MIDPELTLAYSVHSNPGVYALLLGSGLSSSAGIPTGWQITLDLVRKVAALEVDSPGDDPEKWYIDRFSTSPDYSKLLGELGKTPSERQQILKSYIEPTDDDRSDGLKIPQEAHRAIARLAAAGILRVIVTTNFDRLLEKALEDEGVTPTVIDSADTARGAVPLSHSGCTVVKLNGDYLDTRIRNTEAELSDYDPEINKLLDRILDEYGLIVCGWSADWDHAIRKAIERASNRRYSTYWATRGDPTTAAKKLITNRAATTLSISDADTFFLELEERVKAMSDLSLGHPLSKAAAVATYKRYLVDPGSEIRRHEFLVAELDKTVGALELDQWRDIPRSGDELKKWINEFVAHTEAQTATLCALMATAGRWGSAVDGQSAQHVIQKMSPGATPGVGGYIGPDTELYPTLLAYYACGIVATAYENYHLLAQLFQAPIRVGLDNMLAVEGLSPWKIRGEDLWKSLPGFRLRHTPINDRIQSALGDLIPEFSPVAVDSDQIFDRWELFMALQYLAENQGEEDVRDWMPIGCFIWRRRSGGDGDVLVKIKEEAMMNGSGWKPLQEGLFGGSMPVYEELHARAERICAGLSQIYH